MPQGTTFVDTASGDLKYQGTSGTAAIIARADGSVHLVPLVSPYSGSSGFESIGDATFTGIGIVLFDPSAIFNTNGKVTRAITFQVILESTPSVTSEIQLYNITAGQVVSGSLLSTSNNSPTILSGSLVIGASPNLPNSQQIYEVQLRISNPSVPTATDRAICKLAQLVVTWT